MPPRARSACRSGCTRHRSPSAAARPQAPGSSATAINPRAAASEAGASSSPAGTSAKLAPTSALPAGNSLPRSLRSPHATAKLNALAASTRASVPRPRWSSVRSGEEDATVARGERVARSSNMRRTHLPYWVSSSSAVARPAPSSVLNSSRRANQNARRSITSCGVPSGDTDERPRACWISGSKTRESSGAGWGPSTPRRANSSGRAAVSSERSSWRLAPEGFAA